MQINDDTNAAKLLAKQKYQVRKNKVTHLVLHHYGLAWHGVEMITQFQDTKQFAPGYYTGGKCPYHFFIRQDGQIDQCLPLNIIGPAAKKFNAGGIQIALAGDQTKAPPTAPQREALLELCTLLQDAYLGKLIIVGHTEEAGASNDSSKDCPGRFISLDDIRQNVKRRASLAYLDPRHYLEPKGIVCYA